MKIKLAIVLGMFVISGCEVADEDSDLASLDARGGVKGKPKKNQTSTPEPTPEPMPEPAPEPKPEPTPEPMPEPMPEPAPTPEPTIDPGTVRCSTDLAVFRAAVLEVTNQARSTGYLCGENFWEATQPLQWSSALESAAISHSTDMATNGFFDHTGSDGSRSVDRAKAAGFTSSYVGENIGAGQPTLESVQNGWLGSTGHCENIMRSRFNRIGASCVEGDYPYWTVVLGRQ